MRTYMHLHTHRFNCMKRSFISDVSPILLNGFFIMHLQRFDSTALMIEHLPGVLPSLKRLTDRPSDIFWLGLTLQSQIVTMLNLGDNILRLFDGVQSFYPWLGNTTPYVNNIKMPTNFFSSIYCLSVEVSFPSRAFAVSARALVIILVSSQGTVCVCPMTFDREDAPGHILLSLIKMCFALLTWTILI